MQGEGHRARILYTKQDIKRGHTHEYPYPPFSVSKIVFCVLSFDSRYSADPHGQVANGHKCVKQVFFGRVPLKGTPLFFHWYLQE